MHTKLRAHETTNLQAWGGVYRVGSSHSVRMHDVQSTIALDRGVMRLTTSIKRGAPSTVHAHKV